MYKIEGISGADRDRRGLTSEEIRGPTDSQKHCSVGYQWVSVNGRFSGNNTRTNTNAMASLYLPCMDS
ncbi:hypothetical protein JQN29_28030 [Klebsiella pneumoniae]|nr:hypothetical protein [Klebsiella pneumoniae]